jgi:hypothetical protein
LRYKLQTESGRIRGPGAPVAAKEKKRRESVLFKAVFLLFIVVIVGALLAGLTSKK